MIISIVGFGYIGSVIGSTLASQGHKVHCIDNDPAVINSLNRGITHIPEPALQELTKRGFESGNLIGSTTYDNIKDSEVILITVGTPLSDQFEADLTALNKVFEQLAPYIVPNQTIMIKSTVPPGVTRKLADKFFGDRTDIFIGFSPERLAEGNAVEEFQRLPIVVGGINAESTLKCSEFWTKVLSVEVIQVSSCEAAELVKLANNQWIDLNIALSNELAKLCDALPFELDVLEIIAGANSLKKGQHYVNFLTPSIGVGGYCLTKDPWFVSSLGKRHNVPINLPQVARDINDSMPRYVSQAILQYLNNTRKPLSHCKIAILGYSFKSNSGDIRFTPMENFLSHMIENHIGRIDVFDSTIQLDALDSSPAEHQSSWAACLENADCVVFGAGHEDIKSITVDDIASLVVEGALLYDGRRYFDQVEIQHILNRGMSFQGVGRTKRNPKITS